MTRGAGEQWAIDHGVTVIQQDGSCFDGVDLNELIEYMRERDGKRCCDYATDSSGTVRFHLKDCPDNVTNKKIITEAQDWQEKQRIKVIMHSTEFGASAGP